MGFFCLVIKMLVAFLVTNAKSDQTAPPSWLLDTLLRGVEKFVLHELNRPLVFADICLRASRMVTDQAARLLLCLGQINGLRRVATTTAEVASVKALFDGTESKINALPESPRKERLASFLQYQAGVFMARNGFYQEASMGQLRTFANAPTRAEREIGRFLSRVYLLWGSLVDCDDPTINAKLLVGIIAGYEDLERAVKGTAHEAQWGLGNGPIHILQGYIWIGVFVSDSLWDKLYPRVKEAAQKSPAFAEWAEVLEVVRNLQGGNDTEAFALATAIIARSSDPNAVATCRLLKARLLRANGAAEEALARYAEIQPVPDCHQVAAVAARESAALQPPLC